jgi:hypothetical protein
MKYAVAFPDPTSKKVDTLPFIFDCDEKVYHLPDGPTPSITAPLKWEKNGAQYSLSSKTITNAFSIACKKAWELWK